MFLALLLCLLPVTKGSSCFRCWPELPALLEYDLQVLWGSPGPPAELSQRLRSLFLDDNTLPVPGYLARDHLEEETAAFFTHLDHSIKKLRDDKPALLDDIHIQMGLLAERLMERSQELTQKACNESCDLLSPMEVTACANCQTYSLSCNDPTVCTDKSVGTYKWAVILVSILLALAVAAICAYFFWLQTRKKERKKKRKKKEKLDEGRSSQLPLSRRVQQPEQQPEYKPEQQPEHKPEQQPEHKPQQQPEHKPEQQPE
ncbi:testis-expressed protein 51 [Psammomys obesus]|uniref:testis-expressed protein 51 n=1 Tax=Psammomys obesus TaxID=48139 RepID=UPI002452A457|nr:testis-expressed protein 51 [Psammomys obesus]